MESKDILGSCSVLGGARMGPSRLPGVCSSRGSLSAPLRRGDAEARAGRVGLRGLSFLQARHPQGADRTHLHDRAEEGESLTAPRGAGPGWRGRAASEAGPVCWRRPRSPRLADQSHGCTSAPALDLPVVSLPRHGIPGVGCGGVTQGLMGMFLGNASLPCSQP